MTARIGLLVAAFALAACAPATSRLGESKPQLRTTYFFARLSGGKSRAVERLAQPDSITARFVEPKQKPVYVISDAGVAAIARFDFEPLESVTVEVDLERVSDLSGAGLDNGAVRRRAEFARAFEGEQVFGAFDLLQRLATDPEGVARAEAAQEWATVGTPTQVDAQEGGFAVRITAELQTGNPFDPTARVVLYRLESQTEYQRAADATPLSQPASPPTAAE